MAKPKKAKKSARPASSSVAATSAGPPFGIVVLIATVMSIPTIMQFVDQALPFDATVLRFLAALAVSWILVHLVYAVANSFQNEEPPVTTTTNATHATDDPFTGDPTAQYRTPFTPDDPNRR